MSRHPPTGRGQPQGPSQRQLRAGELVRHALVEILREAEISDPALEGGGDRPVPAGLTS